MITIWPYEISTNLSKGAGKPALLWQKRFILAGFLFQISFAKLTTKLITEPHYLPNNYL